MLKFWSASRNLFSNDFLSFLSAESRGNGVNSDSDSEFQSLWNTIKSIFLKQNWNENKKLLAISEINFELKSKFMFSAQAKTLVLILELLERFFTETAAHGDTDAWGLFV